MNVYDFDKTIYNGDSTIDFFKFCIRRKPLLLRYAFTQITGLFGYLLGFFDKTRYKERFFRFLSGIDDIDGFVSEFWVKHENNLMGWYLAGKTSQDVIISASPEFLLDPICKRLSVETLIASRVDAKEGTYTGINCFGKEKVRRFREIYPSGEIDRFFSDSLSDTPMSELAKESFIIVKGQLIEWSKYRRMARKRIKN